MIFVTGGTGLLGNNIVRTLCEQGQAVRVLCRPASSRIAFDDLPVEIFEGDLSDAGILNQAVSGCTAVIHSAAMIHIGWQQLEASRSVNVAGTQRLADACRREGIRLVHISTVDTLPAAQDAGHPIHEESERRLEKTPCSYVISKTEAERVVEQQLAVSDLDAVIIHPGFMLGPFDWKPSSGRMMLEVNRAPVLAAPPGGCSACDARDVAQAIVTAVTRASRGEHYILAGENMSYQALWQSMLQATGRQRRVWKLGRAIQVVGKLIDATVSTFRLREGDVNGAAIAMGTLNHYYDSSKAERELDYHRRDIDETLNDAWQWLRQHGASS